MPMTVVCFGILVADVFLPLLPRMPRAGELVPTEDFLVQPGGCGANTALALARLGIPASAIGMVGDDPFGQMVRAELGRRAVDVTGVRAVSGMGTSKTVIVDIANEDRRYFHTIGANAALGASALDGVQWAPGDILYVGGYLVLPGVEAPGLADRLRAARAAGARTVLDVCVPSGAAVNFSDMETVLAEVDFFLPNQDEGQALTGAVEPACQAEAFLAAGAATVIITCGHAGALMATPSRQLWAAAPVVDAVDSSGAGDAFAAGFICGLLEGWPDEKSLIFASVVGASACTALGCTAGVFSRAQAENYIAHHSLTLA